MERKVIVIAGPTCSGKTEVSISAAGILETEIISADSRQIYKLLNIGTAKPSAEILKKINHHLVDVLNPDQPYDANLFEIQSSKIIDELLKNGKVPIVTGGSGLYIKALVDGLYDITDKDNSFREKLLYERESLGNEYLYKKLIEADPESASKMIPQNWKRVMRALEVFHLTGKSILHHQQHSARTDKPDFLLFGIKWDREVLYKRINKRVDDMIASGLPQEVEHILSLGYPASINSLNTVGYKEIISYFNGQYDLEKAVELIKRNTRRYAKRQLTWFNADKRINWINIGNSAQLKDAAEEIVNIYYKSRNIK